MPKKSSSKPPTPKPADPVPVEEKKASSTPEKPGKEIEEIFAGKKRKKPQQDKAKKLVKSEAAKPDKLKKKNKRKVPEDSGVVGPPSWPKKRTSDRFTIYTEEELGIGRADAGVCYNN